MTDVITTGFVEQLFDMLLLNIKQWKLRMENLKLIFLQIMLFRDYIQQTHRLTMLGGKTLSFYITTT